MTRIKYEPISVSCPGCNAELVTMFRRDLETGDDSDNVTVICQDCRRPIRIERKDGKIKAKAV